MAGDLAQLEALQCQMGAALAEWKDERKFHPHLTIGRVRDITPRAARQVGAKVGETSLARLGEWRVGEVQLMQSNLSPKGAQHFRLASAKLRGSPGEGE